MLKIAHKPSFKWMHAIPAGLPLGIPGIGELIDISTQQAPQQLQVTLAIPRIRFHE